MTDDATTEETAKKGLGLIPAIGIGAVTGVAAAAGAFFLAPIAAPPDATHKEDSAKTEKDDKAKKKFDDKKDVGKNEKKKSKAKGKAKKKKSGGKKDGKDGDGGVGGSVTEVIGDSGYLKLEPMLISINPTSGVRHLKIELIIETPVEEIEKLAESTYHIKDVLNTYLRSLETGAFEDPAAMARLRAQIRRRIRLVEPEIDVRNVLITEFVLT